LISTLTSSQVSSSPSVTDIQSETSDQNIIVIRKPRIEALHATPAITSFPSVLSAVDPEEDEAGGAAEKTAGSRHSCFLGMVVSILSKYSKS
jgi:hypothetical protein